MRGAAWYGAAMRRCRHPGNRLQTEGGCTFFLTLALVSRKSMRVFRVPTNQRLGDAEKVEHVCNSAADELRRSPV